MQNRQKNLRLIRRLEYSYPIRKVRRTKFVRHIHRPEYNWIICFSCTLLIFVTLGLVSSGFSVYFPFLVHTYNLSNTQISLLTTFRCLASLISMLCIGPFYKWSGMRRGVTFATFSAFLSFIVFGISKSFLGFSIASAFAGISYGMGSMIPVSILINRWFDDCKSLALGICSAGSGIATVVASPAITYLIGRTSLSTTFFLEAFAVFLLLLFIFYVIKDSPAQIGLEPYHTKAHKAAHVHKKIPQSILSGKQLALLTVASLIVGALANPGFVNVAMLYATENYSSADVAFLVSVLGIFLIIGKILFGYITDSIGGFRSNAIFTGILLLGLILAVLAPIHNMILASFAAIILGIGFPLATIAIPVWAGDLAEPENFPKVVRRLQVLYATGAFAFSFMPGIIADHFGSYTYAYGTFAAMLLVMFAMIAAAYKLKSRTGEQ